MPAVVHHNSRHCPGGSSLIAEEKRLLISSERKMKQSSRQHRATNPLPYLCVLVHVFTAVTAFSAIHPGTGLVSKRRRDAGLEEVLIFEHTERGTGGLVLNQPTPCLLQDLNIPRFEVFGSNALMLGCGMQSDGSGTNVAIGEMSPWFWCVPCDFARFRRLHGWQ